MGNSYSASSSQSAGIRHKPRDVYSASTQNIQRRKLRMVCIGINYLGTSAQLGGCVHDAVSMGTTIVSRSGFTSKEGLFLTDDVQAQIETPEGIPSVTTAFPSRDNILRAIEWLFSSTRSCDFESVDQFNPIEPDTLCLFYYAGHGSWVWDQNGDESDFRDETLCPMSPQGKLDSFITDDEIRSLLEQCLRGISQCTLIVITDCCHSGSNFDLKYVLRGSRFTLTPEGKNYTDSSIPIIHIAGCRDNQVSSESESGGFMTLSLLQTLAKPNLTISTLNYYLRYYLSQKISYTRQAPVISSGSIISVYHKFPL